MLLTCQLQDVLHLLQIVMRMIFPKMGEMEAKLDIIINMLLMTRFFLHIIVQCSPSIFHLFSSYPSVTINSNHLQKLYNPVIYPPQPSSLPLLPFSLFFFSTLRIKSNFIIFIPSQINGVQIHQVVL